MKITKSNRQGNRETITVKTRASSSLKGGQRWWKADSKAERAYQLLETASFLKEQLDTNPTLFPLVLQVGMLQFRV